MLLDENVGQEVQIVQAVDGTYAPPVVSILQMFCTFAGNVHVAEVLNVCIAACCRLSVLRKHVCLGSSDKKGCWHAAAGSLGSVMTSTTEPATCLHACQGGCMILAYHRFESTMIAASRNNTVAEVLHAQVALSIYMH